jgi:hypothetical protein
MSENNYSMIWNLYRVARQDDGAEFSEMQKEAVRMLKTRALQGDEESREAVTRLLHAPDIHPFMREILTT